MMTPEQKRITIAEACGLHPGDRSGFGLPDYLKDLNAMNEAEKTFSNNEQRELYADILHRMHRDQETRMRNLELDFRVLHATASQRAEAFGLTLGLWTYDNATQPGPR